MASGGIRRKVDDLGRVVIPAGIRRQLNIREGDTVEVTVDGERVVLARPHDTCVFCGGEDGDLQPFRGRLVCRDCVDSIREVDGRLRAVEHAPAGTPPVEVGGPRPQTAQSPHAAQGPQAPERSPDLTTPLRLRSGPIDGDALARQEAARQVQDPPTDDKPRRPGSPPDDDRGRPQHPPHHDPASTTSW